MRVRPVAVNAVIAWLFVVGSSCFALGATRRTQLPGTVFFHVSAFGALTYNATAAEEDRHVWRAAVQTRVTDRRRSP
ncbi:hypothetical protein [Krasilnikoviella flava]|uniref:Uncharacterized protein n=1 Tax=Krasilnikoviella flava TaxID=526729 RepID=A0A1T5L8E8_9MICO|nr:hypothetical protein [Krasilnikoviella flava]SKC72223.1 hypothetical protein SAMN04324258_3124 [Krasilnikoviella flava]